MKDVFIFSADLRIISHACGNWPPDCSKSDGANTFIMTSRIKFFDVIVFLFLNLDSAPKFMSILLLSLELRQFSFIENLHRKLKRTSSEFCLISGD